MMTTVSSFIASTLRLATPTLIAALGIVFSERAGVVNIGTEGMMLMGSLAGVMGSYYTGSALLGALIAMLTGCLFAMIFAFFTLTPDTSAAFSLPPMAYMYLPCLV